MIAKYIIAAIAFLASSVYNPRPMKTCPFCAEPIQEAAVVCKHCGRDLKAVYLGRQPVVRVKKATSPIVKYGLIVLALLLLYWSIQATYF